jgi:hypothetical protein
VPGRKHRGHQLGGAGAPGEFHGALAVGERLVQAARLAQGHGTLGEQSRPNPVAEPIGAGQDPLACSEHARVHLGISDVLDDQWRASQQARPAGTAGQVRALDERLHGPPDVATPILGGGQLQQHLTPTGGIEPAARGLPQGQSVQAGRFLVTELLVRLACRHPRVPDRSRPVAGLLPVRRQPGRHGRPLHGGLLPFALQRLGDPAMIPQPVDGPQALEERLPDQCVREAEPPWPLGRLVEELGPHRLVHQPQDPFRRGTADPGQELGREAGAHQGGQLQRPARLDAQAVKTPLQHLADAWRQTQRLVGSKRCRTRQTSLGPEQPHQLGGEERVSPGGLVDPSGDGCPRRLPGDGGQVLGEVGPVQPFQTDPSGLGPAGQVGERDGDRPIRCHLLLAEGHHEEHRVEPELADEVAKEQQRGRVGPVRIIQHDHQATPARCGSQERRGRVEEPESGLATVIGSPADWSRGGPRALVRSLELRHHSKQGCRIALQSLPVGGIRPK